MNESNQFVRFDWAAKRMLRDKANFGVIEGLLTILQKVVQKVLRLLL